MGPKTVGSARLVSDGGELQPLCEIYNPLIIQEVLDYSEVLSARFRQLQMRGDNKKSFEWGAVWIR